jgi:hypothetical protein
MKPPTTVALATWVLEHLTFRSDTEALSGDLLEELRAGRSNAWYWRQVLLAIGIRIWIATSQYGLPLIFSAAWSILYPLWRIIGRNWLLQELIRKLVHAMPDRWVAHAWPYSTMLDLADGILPAITFIWLGLLVYLISRPTGVPSFRIFLGLSTSLSVLLVATIGLFYHLKNPVIDVPSINNEAFYSLFRLFAINIPVASSLLAAILSVFPRTRQIVPRQPSRG